MPEDPPAACVICGNDVAAGELAPEIARLPQATRLPIHAACFQAHLKDSRARGDAWARSPRGRLALTWLRVRVMATAIAAVVLTVLAGVPITVWQAVRGRRLRRAVCSRFLAESRAVVIVGFRSSNALAKMHDVFSASWSASADVVVVMVDSAAPFAKTDLARAAWEHWGRDPKPPHQRGIVIVPRQGDISRVPIGHTLDASDMPLRDRLMQARAAIDAALLR